MWQNQNSNTSFLNFTSHGFWGFCLFLVCLVFFFFFWLCWVFIPPQASLFVVYRLQGACAAAVPVHGLRCPIACGILVPRPVTDSMSLALAGRFLTTGPPGKFLVDSKWQLLVILVCTSLMTNDEILSHAYQPFIYISSLEKPLFKCFCNTLQHSCLKNPRDRGAWQAAVHGIAKSQTRVSNWA